MTPILFTAKMIVQVQMTVKVANYFQNEFQKAPIKESEPSIFWKNRTKCKVSHSIITLILLVLLKL